MTEIAIAPERIQTDPYGSGSVAVANCVQQAEASHTSSYDTDYQPTYKDPKALNEVLLGLAGEEGVTTPDNIDNVRRQYSKIAENKDNSMVLVTGLCAEPVLITQDIDKMSQRYLNLIQIGKNFRAVQALRACGQSAKPRSSEYEELKNEDKIPSYYGDMVNSKDVYDREPDPDRMLVTAQQGKDVQDNLTQQTGGHV
ncbi:MAG: 3-deoxy-7-phosphoheptulonate synthase, partial [Patescibacteria group bacterium]